METNHSIYVHWDVSIKYPFGFKLIWHLRFVIRVFLLFFSFFFFVQPAIVDKSTVNSAPVHCSRVPQITLFNNFFIKNGSHSTIYTFKNYFATVFSVSVSVKINCIQMDPKCQLSSKWCSFPIQNCIILNHVKAMSTYLYYSIFSYFILFLFFNLYFLSSFLQFIP